MTTQPARSETERLRAELEQLRDFKELLAFVDDAGTPVMKSHEEMHKHHADEPYIGCLFCRDRFEPKPIAPPGIVMLRVPCATEVLPKLLAGLPVFSIRVEDKGDGTHDLIVHGVKGPLSDPFEREGTEA